MTTQTASLVEINVLNGFFTHRREFDDIDEAVKYCNFLKGKGFDFTIFDPEYELEFTSDEVDHIEDYFNLEYYEKRNVWFLVNERGSSLSEALECYIDVYCYSEYDSVAQIMESQVRDGCFGSIDDSLIEYLDFYRMAESHGESYYETRHGIFSFD